MGKILVLTEKPSVARDIAKVLGCNQKGNGCLIGAKYIITWALGHLVTLADPEVYDEKYKKWRLQDLPMLPDKMKLVVIKDTSKQYKQVQQLMKSDEVNELIIATDSGREGELVARWIISKAGFKKPISRLWISSQTDKAIKEGFANLKNGKEYDNLYLSAQCRAEADWIVGLNITRALTCKYNAQLSAGRVQTPTLAMVIQREDEIQKFVPKDYWVINGITDKFSMQWIDKSTGQMRIFDKTVAESIITKVTGHTGKIIDIKKEAKKELPPLAYDLTTLQMDANKKYGYSAKQTLSIMQKLYEFYKLVTYPRTDSKHITEDIVPTLNERLKSIAVGPYKPMVNELLKNPINPTKRFVDNTKVSDHHAIIPTEQHVNLGVLNQEERNVYDLIIKRFVAVLSEPFEYQQTTIKIDVNGELFVAKGKMVKSSGWKAIYKDIEHDKENENDEEDQNQSLPEVKKGDEVKVLSVKLINRKTKPPARYTEATLLQAMEHAGKFIEDAQLKEAIEDGKGLGTPATRAEIIEKLFSCYYLERKGKEIIPTNKGTQLINLVPSELKSPELTAKWEQQLVSISKGSGNAKEYIKNMKNYATQLVSNVITSNETFKHDNVTKEKCPRCGKNLLSVNAKKGKMLVCQDGQCGYRSTEEQLSRNEVKKYMNNNDNNHSINSSLFDALSKWKENSSD